MFKTLMESMKTGVTPQFVFQGVLIGLNGSEERVVYRECIPSGDIDLQNVATLRCIVTDIQKELMMQR